MISGTGNVSFMAMLAHADIVVQAVSAALVIGSMACWAVIFGKIARIVALRRAVAGVEAFAQRPATGVAADGLLSRMVDELKDEAARQPYPTAETRPRVETALRALGSREIRAQEGGLSYLATLASTAPFIGLFGTVWGIMHSFTAIADAQDTSLAAVAPGIAEALLATAVGLGTAIPAVVGYNQIRAALGRCGYRLGVAAAAIAKAAAAPSTRQSADL